MHDHCPEQQFYTHACAPVQALAEEVHARQAPNEAVLAEERKKKNYVEFYAVISLKDPFRLVLSEMRDRLFHTREILHHCLVHARWAGGPNLAVATPAHSLPDHMLDPAPLPCARQMDSRLCFPVAALFLFSVINPTGLSAACALAKQSICFSVFSVVCVSFRLAHAPG
jgi:hypothetical protein